jgi:hypothetical protein
VLFNQIFKLQARFSYQYITRSGSQIVAQLSHGALAHPAHEKDWQQRDSQKNQKKFKAYSHQ